DTALAGQIVADYGNRVDSLIILNNRCHNRYLLSCFCFRLSFSVCLPFFCSSRLPLSFLPLSPIDSPFHFKKLFLVILEAQVSDVGVDAYSKRHHLGFVDNQKTLSNNFKKVTHI
ncbi:MAG: hypothetical protein PVH58_19195, partial [Desulfobacterales bacterium]